MMVVLEIMIHRHKMESEELRRKNSQTAQSIIRSRYQVSSI